MIIGRGLVAKLPTLLINNNIISFKCEDFLNIWSVRFPYGINPESNFFPTLKKFEKYSVLELLTENY
jgi:hypothetical protein